MNSDRASQFSSATWRLLIAGVLAAFGVFDGPLDAGEANPPDRVTCFYPLSPGQDSVDGAPVIRRPDDFASLRSGFDPQVMAAWSSYLKVWQAHHDDPSDAAIRRFLGLAGDEPFAMRESAGRAAPSWLRWRRGSYRLVESPHFQVFTKADVSATRDIVTDLERTHWVWTQLFFPLWESRDQVAAALSGMAADENAGAFVAANRARLIPRGRMRVVVFSDKNQYQAALADSVPGIEQSTGFYGDRKRTIFLYATDDDSAEDVATRRHELTHQLFREATASGLRQTMPGSRDQFWLVEGIAGYSESLRFHGGVATIGGWDSPRLQYARFRVFTTADFLPPRELHGEGIAQVQRRADLARWYAHAIMQTHWLMDQSGIVDHRLWVLTKLAELYRIELELRDSAAPPELTLGDMQQFLSVSDSDLIANPVSGDLHELCLAGCTVSPEGLATVPPQDRLRWLDLSGLKIGNDDVRRLIPDPSSLRQVSLEATDVDAGISRWLARARHVQELDLSWTGVGDELATPLPEMKGLQTLWLTGSRVGDAVLAVAGRLPELTAIDVQRTRAATDAVNRLGQTRPNLRVNPLALRDTP